MRFRRVVSCLAVLTLTLGLTGCGDSQELAELKSIEALNGESELVNLNMSASEKEAAIYAHVSNRTLLDLSTLTPVGATDRDAIVSYMESVDAQLCGSLNAKDGVIDSCYTDYLLMEFEKTPYYWQRSSMNIRGMDAASRSIIVDVTYQTLGFEKKVEVDSFIVRGEPDYDQKMRVRFERWMKILNLQYESNFENEAEVKAAREEFEEHYGKVEDILKSQRELSLTDTVYETGNQITYSGMLNNEQEKCGGTMVVRYVLVPQYTLGINQGYTCRHMYVMDYELANDMTAGRTAYNEEDSASIAENVYNIIFRYYKCLEEDNFTGLYSLNDNFATIDRHFEDYFDTTYRKYDNFTLTIFNIQGTRIECGVEASVKRRAKGSNMSLPIYKDRYYYVLELVDGSLKIKEEVLLSSKLEGEPVIDTSQITTTGFSSSIALTNNDKRDLEKLIAAFGAQQLLGDASSDDYADLVDMSLSKSQLDSLKSSMLSITGKTKAVWIISYLQGQQNYASIKCRELVQNDAGKISELVITYDFIYKGGKWVIYDYQILSRVGLDTTDLTTKNALCIVTAGSVDSLVSQVEADSNKEETPAVDVETIGEVIDYQQYDPVLKKQGEADKAEAEKKAAEEAKKAEEAGAETGAEVNDPNAVVPETANPDDTGAGEMVDASQGDDSGMQEIASGDELDTLE